MTCHLSGARSGSWKRYRLFAWILFMLTLAPASWAADSLFTIEPAQSPQQMRQTTDPALTAILDVQAFASVHRVQAHADLLSDQLDVLQIPLGDGRIVSASKLFYRTTATGAVWRGEIAMPGAASQGSAEDERLLDELNSVVLVRNADQVTGIVRVGGEVYRILPLNQGGQVLVKVDQSKKRHFGEESDAAQHVIRKESAAQTMESTAEVRPRDGISTIRVMIVATPMAVERLGGNAGFQAQSALVIEESNQSFVNSDIPTRFESAGTYIANYDQQAQADGDRLLDKIESRSDRDLGAPTWALRDEQRADMVVLVADIRSYCGLANLNSSKATAYGAVDWTCFSDGTTVQHEIGHNIGADHTPEEAQGNVFPYGSGHQKTSGDIRWSTIMAPYCSRCSVINYWSNPYRTYKESPLGVVNVSDNARVWTLRAPVVASFYPDPVEAVPPYAVARAEPSAVTGPTVVRLDGSQSSDPAGGALRYRWEQTNGTPDVSITGSSSREAQARVPAVGRSTLFSFRLTVTNSDELSDSQAVNVSAEPSSPAPVAVITADEQVETGKSLEFSAAASTGSQLAYAWSLPGFTPASSSSQRVTATAPATVGNRTVQLTVRDAQGRENAKTKVVRVVAGSGGGGGCIPTDPSAGQYPQWDALKNYVGGDTVQHNGVVWRAGWSSRGISPDKTDAFTLVSHLPVPWQTGRPYVAGNQVIHQGKLYQAKYWVNTPPPGTAWTLLGDHACP
ncbi:peptidyl-Asp metalloendopeptidase [Pseudomonas gingeri]|nr:peptidyl-Asp metalloendopeptidase [Pseudomonas gingeri]NWE33777.1 peptidyl-Asp metalloendopeptidase [Pseudomonas gingeri]NWE58137.1 peptidyl-Asp metalloendopeptidase [Pseudomonas gingeri]NWF04496.1 peptidyl-Asp metalloendopeptidase [Pseudomonas gingeri]